MRIGFVLYCFAAYEVIGLLCFMCLLLGDVKLDESDPNTPEIRQALQHPELFTLFAMLCLCLTVWPVLRPRFD